MSEYIFSPSKNAFYPVSMQADYESAGTWPDDGSSVTTDIFNEFSGMPPDNKIRGVDNGRPAWVDAPPPPREELIAAEEGKRQTLIYDAIQSISVIQLKIQAGRKLTDDETRKLNVTLDYIDAVTAIDINTTPDINWPVPPAA